jgi:CRISPR/Cas system-associated exonuclease Cas4 (RecB family)
MEFLKFVVDDLYKEFNGQLENVTVVLPTRRAGLFVKKYLAELAAGKPVCAPECTTITDLFDSLCPLKPADEIKAVCQLYEIYKEKTAGISHCGATLTLDKFYSWGRQLIADFNNVDKNCVDSDGRDIFRHSSEARNFDNYILDEEVKERLKSLLCGEATSGSSVQADNDSYKAFFEQIWEKLPDIYSAFSEKLMADNSALEGARYKWVVTHFEELWKGMSDRTFAFVGFNILLGAERKFMELVKKEGKALFYWDYDKEFEGSHIPAYRNVKQDMENFEGMYDDTPSSKEKPLMIMSATSDNAQARYVHDWLLAHNKAGESSAVILCDEAMLQPVVFSVPQELSGNVNVTKGFPMKLTRIYARICSWLKNTKATSSEFDKTLVELREFIDKEWCANCNPPMPADDSGSASQEWYEMLDRESIFQARCVVVRFISLIKEDVLKEVKEFSTIRSLLTAHLSTVTIPFHGEPITDVQIMGVLETRALDFDNVLLLNVEEGVVPKASHDNSFIPYYLRKCYGLTTLDDQAQVYSYNFFRILRRAKSVTLLYSDAMTSDGQKSMSRFVMQILVSGKMFGNVKRSKLVSKTNGAAQSAEQTQEADGADSIKNLCGFENYGEKLVKEQKPGRPLRISPSAINSYLRCPRNFFMKYMLELEEPEDDSSNLMQKNDLGTLVHESIRAAYTIITKTENVKEEDQGIGAISRKDIEDFLDDKDKKDRAIDMAYASMNADYKNRGKTTAYNRDDHPIETAVAMKYMKNVLSNDSNLEDFKILGNELKKYATLKILDFGSIEVGGSIDRLDMVTDNGKQTIRIVDYKSGSYDAKKMNATDLKGIFTVGTKQTYVLQTMIYSLACLEDNPPSELNNSDSIIKPQLLFTKKNLSSFNPNVTIGGKPVDNFRDWQKDFKDGLTNLVKTILKDTDFVQAPSPEMSNDSPCKTCPFAVLCDRQQLS